MEEVTIRLLLTMQDMQSTRELQVKTWGKDYVIPDFKMFLDVQNGAIVLGAFTKDNKLVGMIHSFPAVKCDLLYQYTDMVVVDEELRGFKIGEKLKNEHKKIALEKGYSVIAWTYDPLEVMNAKLYIHKVGAVSLNYWDNYYGDSADKMNAGIPTDRLKVSWHLKNEKKTVLPKQKEVIKSVLVYKKGKKEEILPILKKENITQEQFVKMCVVNNFQIIKKENQALALKWRLATRTAFHKLFKAGFVLIDFWDLGKRALVHEYVFLKKELLGFEPKNWGNI